ncbi:MAG TPA: hypothetical protein VJM50_24665 [Pyrinomonadaceae bacterium]|nr:hypothetical protein [Pyrinomonadaceae bacterium]
MSFDNNIKAVRVLPFPLKDPYVAEVSESDIPVTILAPDFFPEDSDERIIIKLECSLNDYVAFASALDIGRDIGYGDESPLLWTTWVKALIGKYMTCEDIINCIETNPETQAALTAYLQSSGLVDPNTVNPDATTIPQRFSSTGRSLEDEIGTLEDCNLDVLWGAIRHGIVHYLDDNARNFLDDLVAQADKGQRAADLVSAIPVIGDIGSSLILQFVELAPDLANLFDAFSSESAMDDIACDLFEIVCAECRFPTWDELFSYYASAGITGIDDVENLVLTAATDLLLGSSSLAALVCYYTIITYELFILMLNAKFQGGMGTSALALWSDIGEDFESDNWIALCDGCEPPLFVPEIGTISCQAGEQAVGTFTQVSTHVWQFTSTFRTVGSDWGVSLHDDTDRLFQITATTHISGNTSVFYAYCDASNVQHTGFGIPLNTTMKQVLFVAVSTWTKNFEIHVI